MPPSLLLVLVLTARPGAADPPKFLRTPPTEPAGVVATIRHVTDGDVDGRAGGSEGTVLRANIEAITGMGISDIPEGLEARVSPQEMADLIAFLRGVQQ